jgi:hypothetical protein
VTIDADQPAERVADAVAGAVDAILARLEAL